MTRLLGLRRSQQFGSFGCSRLVADKMDPIWGATTNAITKQGCNMTISVGDKLPDAMLVRLGADGPEGVSVSTLTEGRTVVIFAVPGAYTGTCTTAHVPSFIRTKDTFKERGVEEIICVSVNDPFVMGAWGEMTGATEAGITMVGDPESAFTKAMGMEFSAPPAGLIDRSKRYAMLVIDGEVKVLNEEENPGLCEVSAGEGLLEDM
jgi:peroxiredoxin